MTETLELIEAGRGPTEEHGPLNGCTSDAAKRRRLVQRTGCTLCGGPLTEEETSKLQTPRWQDVAMRALVSPSCVERRMRCDSPQTKARSALHWTTSNLASMQRCGLSSFLTRTVSRPTKTEPDGTAGARCLSHLEEQEQHAQKCLTEGDRAKLHDVHTMLAVKLGVKHSGR